MARKTKVASTRQRKQSAGASGQDEKPKRQAKRRRMDSQMDETSEKERVVIGASSGRPIEIKTPTSFASRKRRRTLLSMREVLAESSKEEEALGDFIAAFAPGSTAQDTWGITINGPVPAVQNLRRHRGFKAFGFRRGKTSAFEKFIFGDGSEGSKDEAPFRFMDLPLEIRWKVYGYLLIYPDPVFPSSDWRTICFNVRQNHAIFRASKQIFLESTEFFYQKNVFYVLISPLILPAPYDKFIGEKFLPYLKNVILEPNLRWPHFNVIQAIAGCIGILVRRGTFLDSLTLVMSPQRESITTPNTYTYNTVTGHNMTLISCFEAPASKIMRIIPKLRCKVLNIVLRMSENKNVLVCINLRGLPVNNREGGWLANDNAKRWRERKLAAEVKANLIGLKKRVEDILEDPEKAILDGKARLLADDERSWDGMRLESRGQKCSRAIGLD